MNGIKQVIQDVLKGTWNREKEQRLRSLSQECTDLNGVIKLNENPNKLRKFAKMLLDFCDQKSKVPADMAEAVEVLIKEGLPGRPDYEYEKPKYLGFVESGRSRFVFKAKFCRKHFIGTKVDQKTGEAENIYRRKERWGFGELYLDGDVKSPASGVKTEAELDQLWKKTKKHNKVSAAEPKQIRLSA